jgi:hypothetical protein
MDRAWFGTFSKNFGQTSRGISPLGMHNVHLPACPILLGHLRFDGSVRLALPPLRNSALFFEKVPKMGTGFKKVPEMGTTSSATNQNAKRRRHSKVQHQVIIS